MKTVGMRLVMGAAAAVMMTAGTAMAGLIEKPPDQGAFWNPLGPDGSYIYADSFVADETGIVDQLGYWMQSNAGAGAGSEVAFEVYGSIGGNAALGPDSTNVIASTGLVDWGGGTDTLDFYSAAPAFSGVLTAGETYWFGANAIGGSGGSYIVGGHTQNSVYNDNGTFWFSNDPTGVDFDGQNNTPEMSFSVNIVPAPAAIAMFGIVGLVGTRRRRR